MRKRQEHCGCEIHMFFISVGVAIAFIGGLFTATIVGAVIGIPMLLIAWPLLKSPIVPAACA